MGGESWSTAPFGQLVENFDSIRVPVKEADRRPGRYPYYGASGVVDHVDSYIFDGEYLLVAEDGENLKTRQTPIAFLATGKFWVNNHAHIVRANATNNTRFLMYAMRVADIGSYLTGSTMPKLTQANMNRVPVVAPPLPEQHAIARILGALDDKIELNSTMSTPLEAMARALFKSWFHEQSGSGGLDEKLVSDLAAEGVLQVGDGYRAKNDELANEGLPFARAGNIDNGFNFADADLLGSPGVAKAGEKVSRACDVVFTSKGTVGRFAFVDPAMRPFVYSPQLCFWRSTNHEALNPFVLRQWMASRWFLDQVDRVKGQTDMAEYVSLRDQRAMRFPLSSVQAQNPIGVRLAEVQQLVWNNERETQTLAGVRDELLPRLLSGELSVAAAEREVEAVA